MNIRTGAILLLLAATGCRCTNQAYTHEAKTFEQFVEDIKEVDAAAFAANYTKLLIPEYAYYLRHGLQARGYEVFLLHRLPKATPMVEIQTPSNMRTFWIDPCDVPADMNGEAI